MDQKKLYSIGEVIVRLRRAKLLSQEELAFQCSLGVRSLSNIETGQNAPTLDTLDAIANAVGIKTSELLYEIGVILDKEES